MASPLFQRTSVQVFGVFRRRISNSWLAKTLESTLDLSDDGKLFAVSLVIADDETLQRLNLEYRGIDEPTDVLSFLLWDDCDSTTNISGEFVYPTTNFKKYGEIVISYPRAIYQARQRKHTVKSEIGMLMVHGILHLMGYDHDRFDNEIEMWSRQEELLATLKL